MFRNVIPGHMIAGLIAGLAIEMMMHEAFTHAASIVTYEVMLESAELTRGDTIVTTLMLEQEDKNVELEVKPVYSCVSTGPFKAVPQRTTGSLPVHVPIRLPSQVGDTPFRVIEVKASVPFAAFKLPRGTYYLGYELRVVVDGQLAAIQPVPASKMMISSPPPRNRTYTRQIEYGVRKPVYDTKTVPGYALVDGRPVEFAHGEATAHMVGEKRVKTLTVDGISREPIPQTALPVAPLSAVEPPNKRVVYFATNRRDAGRRNQGLSRFTSELATTTYGTSIVNIPITDYHKTGQIEERTWAWQQSDPRRFFMIDGVNVLTDSAFVNALGEEDVLLFIHGYNTSLPDAIYRIAELKHDLKFRGTPVAFAWPSAANSLYYSFDERQNKASVPALAAFIERLASRKSTGKLHVLAHSMGNRLLLSAVRQLEAANRIAKGEKLFGRVALCAPDVAPTDFVMLCPSIATHADALTYYYSSSDLALVLSRLLHFDKQSGSRFCYVPGMETIDATEVGRDAFSAGHAYYAASPYLRLDLQLYFLRGLAAGNRRPPLTKQLKTGDDFPYWKFDTLGFPKHSLVESESVIELVPPEALPDTQDSLPPATPPAPPPSGA